MSQAERSRIRKLSATCPQCQLKVGLKSEPSNTVWWSEVESDFGRLSRCLVADICPGCDAQLGIFREYRDANWDLEEVRTAIVWPSSGQILPKAPSEAPKEIAEDFEEAWSVLSVSPKSAAALARRCMQSCLKELGFADRALNEAIKKAHDSPTIPPYIKDCLEPLREFGNFGAHAIESVTGEIIAVEPLEARWTLDALAMLIDHAYVQPARAAKMKAAAAAKRATEKKK